MPWSPAALAVPLLLLAVPACTSADPTLDEDGVVEDSTVGSPGRHPGDGSWWQRPSRRFGHPHLNACRGVHCSGHGACEAGPHGPSCTCDPGYANPRGFPLRCRDVNECLSDNGGCDPLTTCTNVPGGRTCGPCPDGYSGTGESGCVPASLCAATTCERGGTCVEGSSGYACICPPGITGKNCELTMEKLSAKDAFCALLSDGSMRCWGQPELTMPGTFTDIANGHSYVCALDLAGRVACQGNYGFAPLPTEPFTKIAAYGDHRCGIRPDGTVACWGLNHVGQANAPAGVFVALATGFQHSCGIRDNGQIACWGQPEPFLAFGQEIPPEGSFKALASSGTTSCALTLEGAIVCWGSDFVGTPPPSEGVFKALAIVDDYGCAIREDGTLVCWGDNFYGRASPPAGVFKAVTTSTYVGCAVREDDVVACWGGEGALRAPPNGDFSALPEPCSVVECPGSVCTLDSALRCVCPAGMRHQSDDLFTCEADPCWDGANGGCDPLTQCWSSDAGAVCGPCPSGYGGTGEEGCALLPSWAEQQKLVPSVVGAESGIGSATAISGDTALVAAGGERIGANELQGAVYVFVRSGDTWVEQQRLTAPDGQALDGFGRAVAIDGDYAMVGAAEHDAPIFNEGAVYVYFRSEGTWSLAQELLAPDPVDNANFGASIAFAGDTAVIGSQSAEAAYVFERTGSTFTQRQKLTATPPIVGFFGASVTLAGDTLFVGAPTEPGGGSAFVFERLNGIWEQTQKLVGSDVEVADVFGVAIATSGDQAFIAAPSKSTGNDGIQGVVYVYERSDGTWSEQQRLTGSVPGQIDQFGLAMGMVGTTALIGAPGTIVNGVQAIGTVYQFERTAGVWTEQARLVPSDAGTVLPAFGIAFGSSLAMDASTAIIGGPNTTSPGLRSHGSAYVFAAGGSTNAGP